MFGFAIGCYLFLGGLAGALGAVASWTALCVPASDVARGIGARYRRLLGIPLFAAAVLTVISALCLLADAARPQALGALLVSTRVNILTVGAWLLMAFGAAAAILALFWLYARRVRRNKLLCLAQIAELLLGVAVVLYSAVYLAGIRAVPLWHSWWLVPLFAASSFAAACALFPAIAFGSRVDGLFPRTLRHLRTASLVFLVLEVVSAGGFVLTALGSSAEGSGAAALASVDQLLFGPLAFAWWGGFVALGLAGAALFELPVRRRAADRRMMRAFTLATCSCALVGTFSLRMTVMMAGAHPVLGF